MKLRGNTDKHYLVPEALQSPFCCVKGQEHLGIGKLLDETSSDYLVSYFSDPVSMSVHSLKVSKQQVTRLKLEAETRVYWKNEHGYWQIGRVKQDNDSSVYVQFPNDETKDLPHSDLFVRWNLPIEDPTGFLAAFINESPYFAAGRGPFMRSILQQRAVSNGMTGLLSASIRLEDYQYRTVQQILSDPIPRYLLADEVGLGKTIEAGILIRQFTLDHPEQSVVILVPNPLKSQWIEELCCRFQLRTAIDRNVHVITFAEFPKNEQKLKSCSMLVIDEVHQLVHEVTADHMPSSYRLLEDTSHRVESLLLLSATPVLGNEAGFLAMLHLLDPKVYKLHKFDHFKHKVNKRLEVAELIAKIDPEEPGFIYDYLDDISALSPEDRRLQEMVRELGAATDIEEIRNTVTCLRTHISETYKLHRRILRNRRVNTEGRLRVTVPRRLPLIDNGKLYKTFSVEGFDKVINALDDWRNTAFHQVDEADYPPFAKQFLAFVEALLCDPDILCLAAKKRLEHPGNQHHFRDEREKLENIISITEAITESYLQAKFKTLYNLISTNQILEKKLPAKCVMFCSHKESADRLYEYLNRKFHNRVCRHDPNSQEWQQFFSHLDYRVLVCDTTAQEGLNLHAANAYLLHYDFPLSPNQIEQRMGRLDRYGSQLTEVHSSFVACKDNPYESGWISCLEQGFRVFSQSIASLQYLVEEQMENFTRELFFLGVSYIEEFTAGLKGSSPEAGIIDQELLKIQRMDDLDEFNAFEYYTPEKFKQLEDRDLDPEIKISTLDWVKNRLMFDCRNLDKRDVLRFVYNLPDGHKSPTLIPLSHYLDHFLDSIDKKSSTQFGVVTPPVTFKRTVSVEEKIPLLRYGDGFIQQVYDFTLRDDRGKSYAFWRQIPNFELTEEGEPDLVFRFDFIIETDLSYAKAYLEDLTSEAEARGETYIFGFDNLSRQADRDFPPFFSTVFIRGDGEQIEQEYMEKHLQPSYKADQFSRDENLNYRRWIRLQETGSILLTDWFKTCFKVKEQALLLLKKREDIERISQEALEQCAKKDNIAFTCRQARAVLMLEEERQIEEDRLIIDRELRECLFKGIRDPRISLDAIGAFLLSPHSMEEYIALRNGNE